MMTDKILEAMESAIEMFPSNSSIANKLRAAIEEYNRLTRDAEPCYKDVDTEWLWSVLRHADKNPDYFPDIAEGKYALEGDDAYQIQRLFLHPPLTQRSTNAEPVAWMSPGKERLEFSRPDTVYGSHTIPLFTHPPLTQQVPDGYVLVPIEPTVEMREAMRLGTGMAFSETKRCYKAMIEAAPKEESK